MRNKERLQEMWEDAYRRLMQWRTARGMWEGRLSSSAIATSVSVFALQRIDSEQYASYIANGVEWLHDTMKEDGSWGDSVESPSNMTATLLTYVSLYAVGQAPPQARAYLDKQFGGHTEEALIHGVLRYYGRDLTFSVPILTMCALAGVVSSWEKIPTFPFELATLPQRLFRYLNMPVVSYAIPALIAIGICQLKHKGGILRPVRRRFIPRSMAVLQRMQPADGGFLEAAPLTAFVGMCLAEGGFHAHAVTQRCAKFLVDTVRDERLRVGELSSGIRLRVGEPRSGIRLRVGELSSGIRQGVGASAGMGAWPIDTNLSGWVTSLAGKVFCGSEAEQAALSQLIERHATTAVHPFTGAMAGGWGWSDLSGSVPDGDDTSAALVALHHLKGNTPGTKVSATVENGLRWLMALQNNDGGMPTFCRGWGKLPFDRSTPDITAHAMLAMGLWMPSLQGTFRQAVEKSYRRMLRWLEHTVERGGWTPLWFGDQDADDERAPVYGTATVVDYLMQSRQEEAMALAAQQIPFLLDCQNEDGGWGGNKGVRSKVTYTSRVLAALSHFQDPTPDSSPVRGGEKDGAAPVKGGEMAEAKQRGWDYLYRRYQAGTLYENEPVGLYFSRLWYSEELYNVTFVLHALRAAGGRIGRRPK